MAKKADCVEGGTSTQSYPNTEQEPAKGMIEFYQIFALSVSLFITSKGGVKLGYQLPKTF